MFVALSIEWSSFAKALIAIAIVVVSFMVFGIGKKKWDPKGQHVYITGGSQGLGLALAKILAQRGANLSIVARTQSKLDNALKELEALRVSPAQSFQAFSFSLSSASSSAEALEAAAAGHNQFPDVIFCCAGAAKPMFLVDMGEAELEGGMRDGYWVQAWTAWAALKGMVKREQKGKIVFVSSILGLMTIVGYGSYSPAKHALRALAECIRHEGLLYGITTHIFFPPTMYTPGFDEENRTKPAITRKIESADEGLMPEQAAHRLLRGVENGDFHITADIATNLFKASTRGSSPRDHAFIDTILDLIALIAVPVWRGSADNQVVAHKAEHNNYLHQKGFFDDSLR